MKDPKELSNEELVESLLNSFQITKGQLVLDDNFSEIKNAVLSRLQSPAAEVEVWPNLNEILTEKERLWKISDKDCGGIHAMSHQQGFMDAMQWIHKWIRSKALAVKPENNGLSFEDCLREEFLFATENYPERYHQLFKEKFNRAKSRYESQPPPVEKGGV